MASDPFVSHQTTIAVKRVTSNKGKRTPGVDNVIWSTLRQKTEAVKSLHRRGYRPLPLRRIYIPKKNGKKRPLSIPTMRDGAMQALYKLALDPVAETMADPNSYGFRTYRSCADAIAQCFNALVRKYSPCRVLEGDINACFDEISQKWMLEHIPMDKVVLRKWFEAGYIESGRLYPSRKGTPQGGIVSPTLANMVLDGMEAAIKKAAPYRSKADVIRYADDFIETGESREQLEERMKPATESFLHERNLSLSEEKTKITRIEDGFDFLGQNIRKYGGKLLIKPSRENVKAFLRNVRDTIKQHWSSKTEVLIKLLNAKVRGWANYHRHVVSGRTFSTVDSCIYRYLWRWMKRRHPNKSKTWLVKKYWSKGSALWVFSTVAKDKEGNPRLYQLIHASSIKIVRHVKIRGEANPYDP